MGEWPGQGAGPYRGFCLCRTRVLEELYLWGLPPWAGHSPSSRTRVLEELHL